MKNKIKTTVSEKQAEQFWKIANEIVDTDGFKDLKNFIAHGKVSVFEHCLNVAKLSFIVSLEFEKQVPIFA